MDASPLDFSPAARRRWRYVVACGASLAALGLGLLAYPYATTSPFLFFLAAVTLSAWYGGLGPAVLTIVAGALAIDYFFEAPTRTLTTTSLNTLLDLVAYAAVALVISFLEGNLRDATARATAAQSVMGESRDQLAIILGGLADGITVQDATGRLIYANDAAARAIGYPSAADLLAAPLTDIIEQFTMIDEDGEPFPPDQLPGRIALGGVASREVVMGYRRRGSGETRWSVVSATPVFGDKGRVRQAINIFRDITERRRAAERQRLLAETSRASAEVSLDLPAALTQLTHQAVAAVGDTCVIRLLSADGQWLEPAATYHPNPEAQAFGEAMLARAPERSTEGLNGRVIRSGEPLRIPVVDQEKILAAIKPEYRPYLERFGTHSILIVPLRVRGRVLGVLSVARETPGHPYTADDQEFLQELADRAAVAVDNARLYQAAQEAIRARDRFLGIAAHELRTPVTSLRGSAQLLLRLRARDALDTERLDRYLGTLDEQSRRLADLIDDLLDVSRLNTNQFPLRLESVDLAALVGRVLGHFHGHAEGHDFALDLALDLAPIRVDAGRIEQVLTNLLENAIKFSPEGGEIRLSLAPEGEGVALRVQDQGIGLAPGTAEAIFAPFGRAANATDRQFPGLGLGLAIAREIVARHGGRIWAESQGEGQGSTLAVWLPRDAPDAAT